MWGADFKLYGRGIFLSILCPVQSSVSILHQKHLEVTIFICSVMTRTCLGLVQFLPYLYRRTGTGSLASRKHRSAVHGTHRHTPSLLAASFICPINASYTQTTSSYARSAYSAMKSICIKSEAVPLTRSGMPLCGVHQDLNARKTRA